MAVDYRETLVTYLHSESLDDAAKTLGITRTALVARMKTIRKAGVPVPRKTARRGISRLEASQLTSIVKKWEKERG